MADDARVSLSRVPWDHPEAVRLRREQERELSYLDGGDPAGATDDDPQPDPPAEEMVATVLLTVDDEAASCGSLRLTGRHAPGYGELRRMYTRPALRRRGLARQVLGALERIAVEQGLTRLVLETRQSQPDAVALYRSAGYRRIPAYGPSVGDARSACYARWLHDVGTRVLVVNGTMGAGKTTIASTVCDLLREAEVPHAWLDADALGQAWPTPPDDPYQQRLVLESLAAVAPRLAARGLRTIVVPRVVEDPADREAYEQIFDGADVSVVRVTASERTRVARLTAREPEGHWRTFALARTRELEASLDLLALDDAVVVNDGRPAREVAQQVMEAVWSTT